VTVSSDGSTSATNCTTTDDSTDVHGDVGWVLTFAHDGWKRPYSQCRPGCADIGPAHTCFHDFTTSCLLPAEDCSGFARWVFWNAAKIDIGSNTTGQLANAVAKGWNIQVTNDIAGKYQNLTTSPGQLIIFGNDSGGSDDPNPAGETGASHVAIYIGDGKVIENGGDDWQGVHKLYDQGQLQYVITVPGLDTTKPGSAPS
jgi:cell wall-associated NlpC family hydrolase